eukprot:scaffold42680_cov67-Phaeocystis_antarctica.AAC.3
MSGTHGWSDTPPVTLQQIFCKFASSSQPSRGVSETLYRSRSNTTQVLDARRSALCASAAIHLLAPPPPSNLG